MILILNYSAEELGNYPQFIFQVSEPYIKIWQGKQEVGVKLKVRSTDEPPANLYLYENTNIPLPHA